MHRQFLVSLVDRSNHSYEVQPTHINKECLQIRFLMYTMVQNDSSPKNCMLIGIVGFSKEKQSSYTINHFTPSNSHWTQVDNMSQNWWPRLTIWFSTMMTHSLERISFGITQDNWVVGIWFIWLMFLTYSMNNIITPPPTTIK